MCIGNFLLDFDNTRAAYRPLQFGGELVVWEDAKLSLAERREI